MSKEHLCIGGPLNGRVVLDVGPVLLCQPSPDLTPIYYAPEDACRPVMLPDPLQYRQTAVLPHGHTPPIYVYVHPAIFDLPDHMIVGLAEEWLV
jgi:hypothetical protein